jgi:hypothetical protein
MNNLVNGKSPIKQDLMKKYYGGGQYKLQWFVIL